jgi:hypothetical protein
LELYTVFCFFRRISGFVQQNVSAEAEKARLQQNSTLWIEKEINYGRSKFT